MDGPKCISINDVHVDLVPCKHCGEVPDEAAATKAIANVDGLYKKPCAVCGEHVRCSDVTLTHRSPTGKEKGRAYWALGHASFPDGAIVDINGRHLMVHKRCFRLVTPYEDWSKPPTKHAAWGPESGFGMFDLDSEGELEDPS